jgi:hypothetical protein
MGIKRYWWGKSISNSGNSLELEDSKIAEDFKNVDETSVKRGYVDVY